MSIQSSLNSMLTTAGYLGGIVRSLYYQKATATEAQAQTAEAKHQTEIQ